MVAAAHVRQDSSDRRLIRQGEQDAALKANQLTDR
jgi:hypothetical protein